MKHKIKKHLRALAKKIKELHKSTQVDRSMHVQWHMLDKHHETTKER